MLRQYPLFKKVNMTNLEALKASVNFPIPDIKIEKILVDNGLSKTDEYTGLSKAFELATAALYVLLVTSADLQEGDYRINATEKSNFIKLATSIYSKYGVVNPLAADTIRNKSNYW